MSTPSLVAEGETRPNAMRRAAGIVSLAAAAIYCAIFAGWFALASGWTGELGWTIAVVVAQAAVIVPLAFGGWQLHRGNARGRRWIVGGGSIGMSLVLIGLFSEAFWGHRGTTGAQFDITVEMLWQALCMALPAAASLALATLSPQPAHSRPSAVSARDH